MNEERSRLLGQAFRDVPLKCGDLELRPFTAGSLLDLQDLKNPLFTFTVPAEYPGEKEAEDPNMGLYPLFEFVWVHWAPEELVAELIDAEDWAAVKKQVRKFARTVPMSDLGEFQKNFAKLNTQTTGAMVESIDEEGGGTGKPGSSPIGLPPSSSTLEALETLPANITSFDDCLLPEPSSTSTPPGFTTEGNAGGPAPLTIPLIPVPTPPGSSN